MTILIASCGSEDWCKVTNLQLDSFQFSSLPQLIRTSVCVWGGGGEVDGGRKGSMMRDNSAENLILSGSGMGRDIRSSTLSIQHFLLA